MYRASGAVTGRLCPYHASVQVRAVEQWLDEGWSPWRVGYGLANLVALAVTVYIYVSQPELKEAHEEGSALRNTIADDNDQDAEADSALISLIDEWTNKIRNVLKYWPDLNRFGRVGTMGLLRNAM